RRPPAEEGQTGNPRDRRRRRQPARPPEARRALRLAQRRRLRAPDPPEERRLHRRRRRRGRELDRKRREVLASVLDGGLAVGAARAEVRLELPAVVALERAERVGGREQAELVAHVPSRARKCLRSRSIARLMRLLMVPRGSSCRAAISESVSPSK